MKPAKDPPNASDPGGDRLLERARASISKAISVLDDCIERISKDLSAKKKYDQAAASHLAWVTKNVSQILGEVRKHEDWERKRGGGVTLEAVHAWLRAMPPAQRAHTLRELSEHGSGRSVLG